jgi:hypothetical protein
MSRLKSLLYFILTIAIIFAIFAAGAWFGYQKALSFASKKHPEIRLTLASSETYTPDYSKMSAYKEFKDSGYSLMLPPGYKVIKQEGDPTLTIAEKTDAWEITIQPKLLRFDETISGKSFIKNPKGDYYILLKETFQAVNDPFLLFQKLSYLPTSSKKITEVKTPYFFGFHISAMEGQDKVEIYRLFDEEYWHNVIISINHPSVSIESMENILATLKNDQEITNSEETGKTE